MCKRMSNMMSSMARPGAAGAPTASEPAPAAAPGAQANPIPPFGGDFNTLIQA